MSARTTSRSVAIVGLVGGALHLVYAVRPSPDPLWAGMHLHAMLAVALLPAALAAAVAGSTHGVARVLAIVGAAVSALGWVLNLLPGSLSYEGSMAFFELLGPENAGTLFDGAALLLGLGLALALGGSAIPSQSPITRIGAGVGALLALAGPIWTVTATPVVDPQTGVAEPSLSIFVLPVGMVAFGVTALIGSTQADDEPADAEAWLAVAGGARTFGVALALFMIAGMLLGRLAGVDDGKLQELAGIVGQVATVALLAVAAWGLRGMSKAPDAGTRSLAGVGTVGALAAAVGAAAVLALVGAALARVLEAQPEAVVGERSPMGIAAWLVALTGLCLASIRVGVVHRWGGLITLSIVTLVFFAIGSFAQVIPVEYFASKLGGASEAAPFIGAALALPGLVLGLVLTAKVASSLTEAYRNGGSTPAAAPQYPPAAGYPAGPVA